jgi:hypothetical protein
LAGEPGCCLRQVDLGLWVYGPCFIAESRKSKSKLEEEQVLLLRPQQRAVCCGRGFYCMDGIWARVILVAPGRVGGQSERIRPCIPSRQTYPRAKWTGAGVGSGIFGIQTARGLGGPFQKCKNGTCGPNSVENPFYSTSGIFKPISELCRSH